MTDPDRAHRQFTSTVRFDWGTSGASAIASGADVAVVVDVLSFTTTLTVAADAGTAVVPWAVGQASAAEYARRTDAVMAVRRRDAGPGDISLSPATLRAGTPPQRLVLPSPNGSTISAQLAAEVPVCTGVSLRNAPAAAQWIAANTDTDAVVAVIAAGEHWPNGALRPCIETCGEPDFSSRNWATGARTALCLRKPRWHAMRGRLCAVDSPTLSSSRHQVSN